MSTFRDEDLKDGGPIHPCIGHEGMSLRDWFAGQVLSGIAAGIAWHDVIELEGSEHTSARIAYLLADAMLKARDGAS